MHLPPYPLAGVFSAEEAAVMSIQIPLPRILLH
jgi:hypothetical protein